MFYLATKQRLDLFLLSRKILLLLFIFTTSVLLPQNIYALNANQKQKKNQFVSVKLSYIYRCNNYCNGNQTSHAYPVCLNYLTGWCETLSPNLVTEGQANIW